MVVKETIELHKAKTITITKNEVLHGENIEARAHKSYGKDHC